MKYYVKKEGLSFSLVVFMGDHIAAKTGIMGQDLGKMIENFTNGEGEEIDVLPEGIIVSDGVVCWKINDPSASEAA